MISCIKDADYIAIKVKIYIAGVNPKKVVRVCFDNVVAIK